MADTQNYENVTYKKTNREKAISPKSGKSWCGCDRCLVGDYVKCPVCGKRNGSFRLKKEPLQ